jgi:hypothetical protein
VPDRAALVPQAHGGALLRGGNTGNRGRWRSRFIAALNAAAQAKRVGEDDSSAITLAADILVEVAAGDRILEHIGAKSDGTPIYAETKNSDRLNAIELMLAYVLGKPDQKLQLEDEVPRETGEQTMARLAEAIPRLLARLPVDIERLVTVLERRRQRELLVSGAVIAATTDPPRKPPRKPKAG